MISIIALVLLAIIVGSYVGKNPDAIENTWIPYIKWGIAISSILWLGGLLNILAVYLIYHVFYTAARNNALGEDMFVDHESWIAQYLEQYIGKSGGKMLYFSELILAILILLI